MMIFKKMKDAKVAVIAGVLGLCVIAGAGGIIVYAQHKTENKIGTVEIDSDGVSGSDLGSWEDILYKETAYDEETAKKVCEKYGLDYETVTLGEMTRDMHNYGYALYTLENDGDMPLLASTAEGKDIMASSSLEVDLGDVHAFGGAREVIMEFCQKENIDPATAKVADLEVEQIMALDEACYQASDHKDAE